MISPELLRRYPFFSGLSMEQITSLAEVAEAVEKEEGEFIFREGDELHHFYLNLEGAIGITINRTAPDVEHSASDQLTGSLQTDSVVVSTVGPGEIFGWSGLLPPHISSANAEVLKPSRLIAFDCDKIFPMFKENCQFGYLMMQKMAFVIRDRLHDMRIESLAFKI